MKKVEQLFRGSLGATTGYVIYTVPAGKRTLLRSRRWYATGAVSNNLTYGTGVSLAAVQVEKAYSNVVPGTTVDDDFVQVMNAGDVLVVVIPTGDSWNAVVSGTVYDA